MHKTYSHRAKQLTISNHHAEYLLDTTMVKVAPAAAGCDHGERQRHYANSFPRPQPSFPRRRESIQKNPTKAQTHWTYKIPERNRGHSTATAEHARYDALHTRIAEQGARNHGAAKAANSSEDVQTHASMTDDIPESRDKLGQLL